MTPDQIKQIYNIAINELAESKSATIHAGSFILGYLFALASIGLAGLIILWLKLEEK